MSIGSSEGRSLRDADILGNSARHGLFARPTRSATNELCRTRSPELPIGARERRVRRHSGASFSAAALNP
jgi:hypothetical protein